MGHFASGFGEETREASNLSPAHKRMTWTLIDLNFRSRPGNIAELPPARHRIGGKSPKTDIVPRWKKVHIRLEE
jgi:hypothetical protein